MRPTLEDIAAAAGVSVSTVSLVLNEKGNISDETRAVVKDAIRKLGYKRQPSGRDIVVFGKPSTDMASALHQAAAEYGYDLIISPAYETGACLADSPAAAGAIVYGGQWDVDVLDRIGTMYPTVLLGGYTRRQSVDSIWVDSAAGIDLAVDLLIEKGHQRIGLVNGPPDTPTSWEKRTGFERAIARARPPVEGLAVDCESFTETDAHEATKTLLQSVPNVSAIIIGERIIASAIYELLRSLGIAVPEGMSLIVFRDDPRYVSSRPPITAIGFSAPDIAHETLVHLVRRIGNPQAHGKGVRFKPYIVERGSVADLRAGLG